MCNTDEDISHRVRPLASVLYGLRSYDYVFEVLVGSLWSQCSIMLSPPWKIPVNEALVYKGFCRLTQYTAWIKGGAVSMRGHSLPMLVRPSSLLTCSSFHFSSGGMGFYIKAGVYCVLPWRWKRLLLQECRWSIFPLKKALETSTTIHFFYEEPDYSFLKKKVCNKCVICSWHIFRLNVSLY